MELQQSTPPVIPAQLVQQPHSSKNLKILLLIFLFLLLGAVITYTYQYYQSQPQSDLLPRPEDIPSPTPDETTEWKTYKNEEYGFEFKYPSTWYIEGTPDWGLTVSSYDPNNYSGHPAAFSDTLLKIDLIVKSKPVDETLRKYIDRNYSFTPTILSVKNIIVDGNKGIQEEYGSTPDEIPVNAITSYIDKGNSVYEITVQPNTSDLTGQFDQILSSFRFVEEGSDEWKTYHGETGYTTDGSTRFSIDYPSSWIIEDKTLYPLGKSEDKGLETRLVLGALGNGSMNFTGTREFPAGEASYYWNKSNYGQSDYINGGASFVKNNNAYIFILENLPAEYENEYKDLFSQILSTFKFL